MANREHISTLNLNLPVESWQALHHWARQHRTTKTAGMIQAIDLLMQGDPPSLEQKVDELAEQVVWLEQRLQHLEMQQVER